MIIKLPNYILNDIIKIIINYLYNIKLKYPNLYSIPSSFSYNHTELFNLCMVNKQFFNSVKLQLNQIINLNNYEIINKINNNSNNNNNNQYSIINSNLKIYNSIKEYNNSGSGGSGGGSGGGSSSNINNSNNKVIIYSSNEPIIDKEITKVIDSTIFKSINSSGVGSGIGNNDIQLLFDWEIYKISSIINDNNINEIKLKEIKDQIQFNTITIYQSDQDTQETFNKILEIIKYFKSRHIVYLPLYVSSYQDQVCLDISSLFESSKSLEYDLAETYQLGKINNKSTSLKSLLVSLNFNDICRIMNGKAPVSKINILNSVKDDWDSMINVLSNNTSLKKFSLFINSINGGDIKFTKDELEGDNKLDLSVITSGIKSIFTSPVSNISTLDISFFDDYISDPLFLDALKENKSIRTLSLCYNSYTDIVQQVLPVNKTIRNLLYREDNNTFTNIFNLLQLLNSNHSINLYSITIYIVYPQQDLNLIQIYNYLINQFNHHSIKEINFYITYNKNLSELKSYLIINNSNTILNIYKEYNQ